MRRVAGRWSTVRWRKPLVEHVEHGGGIGAEDLGEDDRIGAGGGGAAAHEVEGAEQRAVVGGELVEEDYAVVDTLAHIDAVGWGEHVGGGCDAE